ncbi:MAG: DUF3800 domain-containing protein [Planctomycetes bacterium]|nr:DUF3800 domain-containing protein [Planctomycetota bacterium]
MLIFLDESFRQHQRLKTRFGVLAGAAIPEELFPSIQQGLYQIRRPYDQMILKPEHGLKGHDLLTRTTYRRIERDGYSYHYNLVQEVLEYAAKYRIKIFGVVCFRTEFHTFSCADEKLLDPTFRYLFERIDRYMKNEHPGKFAKLIFDDRGRQTNERNSRAITNFFARSHLGAGYDSIVRVPFFAIGRGHHYGMQLADLITTVVAQRFAGEKAVQPLWRIVQRRMLYHCEIGKLPITSLKVMRTKNEPGG